MTQHTWTVGDIHGCATAFETMLSHLQPGTEDRVIVLGDVVDRGPDTKRCVDLLLELQKTCQLVFLMGNHEEMMLDALRGGVWSESWTAYGGAETLDSYGGPDGIPREHLEFLTAAEDYIETQTAICVHANLQPNVPLKRQPPDWLRWMHLNGREEPHPSGKLVVCGHTRLSEGIPAVLEGWVCIDTAACAGGRLTCLDVDALSVVQTSEQGELIADMPLKEIARPFQRRD